MTEQERRAKANAAVRDRIVGVPMQRMSKLEAMMDPTNPHVLEANDNRKPKE